MTISNGTTTPSTGYFEFEPVKGDALIAYHVYNSAASQATVTTRLDFVDGRVASLPPKAIPARTLGVVAPWAAGIRRVTITSSRGSALEFKKIFVLGPP
jgi:hypothetical protein